MTAMESEFFFAWDPVKAYENVRKHGVSFAEAATVMYDPLAVSNLDTSHSELEERWFTLGQTGDGKLLAVAHTYQEVGANAVSIRLISARDVTPRERRHYESTQH